jgi:hypothetical protein
VSTNPEEWPEGMTPRFAKGDLVVTTRYAKAGDPPQLVVLDEANYEESRNRFVYGVHFVQFPHLGRPSGGSAWSTSEGYLHRPQSAHEELLALQYKTREKALKLREQLTQAEQVADAASVVLSAYLEGRS